MSRAANAPPRLALLARRAHVWYCAAVVYLALKATQKYLKLRARIFSAPPPAAIWSRTHTWCAHRIVAVAISRGALWLKFAQYCTSRADVLPPEYLVVLDRCLDAASPLPPAVIERVVGEELGRAVGEVFEGFDSAAPIASASIAQVHRCRLKAGGEEVVLKVQRPGVRALLMQDLEDLDSIITLIAGAEPEFDFHPMLDAWMEMVPLECDFVHEMRNSEFVQRVLDEARGSEFESTAFVPDVLEEYTTERLMCIRFVEGCSIRELEVLDRHAVDRDALIAEISKAFALQVHNLGKWSGDPHSGNILVELVEATEGGGVKWRPGLIDFGITVELTDRQRLGFCRTVCAAAENDSFNLLQSFADMDIVLNRADPQASMETIRHLFRSTASREDTARQSKEFMKRAKEREAANVDSGIAVDRREEHVTLFKEEQAAKGKKGSWLSRIWRRGVSKRKDAAVAEVDPDEAQRRNPVDAYPGFLVFLFRTLGLLRGLSTRLEVEHAYLPIMYGVATKALADSVPVAERMTQVVYPAVTAEGGEEWCPGYNASLSSGKAKKLRKILTRVIDNLERRGLLIGCQVAAFLDGKLIVDVAAGRMGKHNRRPVTPSSLFCPFSATKGVCAILFAELADEYGIEPSDLVGKWWPAYACNDKEATTVGMLLAHRAGLAQAAPEDMRMARLRDDWQGIVDWLAAEAKPSHPPGRKTVYHALNFGWLVAGLIQQVTGDASIQDRLNLMTEKLGIQDECYIGLPKDLCVDKPTSRVATITSELFADIEKLLKVRERKQRGQSSADDAEDYEAALGHNVDALYGDDSTAAGSKGMRFIFERILSESVPSREELVATAATVSSPEYLSAGETQRELAPESNETPESYANPSDTDSKMSDFFKKTPYLVEPSYFSHPVLREAVVPAANGHMSARALAKLYSMLAHDGEIDGKQILKPGRVAKMMEVSVPSGSGSTEESSAAVDDDVRFGAGLRVYDCLDRRGRKVDAKAAGHQGIGGSVGFCVPTKKFAMAFTCNQLNAFSAAGAIIISTVCAVLNVPAPTAYAGLMHKLREDGVDSIDDAFESLNSDIDAAMKQFDVMRGMTG
jgi:predicted unusual protein kinase regulating ubiquinone biosynthesis (AarF/ABC1/UbiB family)/CubicO group peptidase (beta-lactamase class C family)